VRREKGTGNSILRPVLGVRARLVIIIKDLEHAILSKHT
jgi:hypothetical protein